MPCNWGSRGVPLCEPKSRSIYLTPNPNTCAGTRPAVFNPDFAVPTCSDLKNLAVTAGFRAIVFQPSLWRLLQNLGIGYSISAFPLLRFRDCFNFCRGSAPPTMPPDSLWFWKEKQKLKDNCSLPDRIMAITNHKPKMAAMEYPNVPRTEKPNISGPLSS